VPPFTRVTTRLTYCATIQLFRPYLQSLIRASPPSSVVIPPPRLLLGPPTYSNYESPTSSDLTVSPSSSSAKAEAARRLRRHLLSDNSNFRYLIPYADWQVILHNTAAGQLVLWNGEERKVVAKRLHSSDSGRHHHPDDANQNGLCPQCGQPLPFMNDEVGSFTAEEYFRLLETSFRYGSLSILNCIYNRLMYK
jgi:hypothetical protein